MAKKEVVAQEVLDQVSSKVEEVMDRYDAFKRGENIAGEKVSPNTARTQLNLLSRELKTLRLIKELVSLNATTFELDMANAEFLHNLLTPTGSRITTTVKVEEGDSLMDIMTKYPKVQNLLDKATKAANAAGLVLGADGVYHRA